MRHDRTGRYLAAVFPDRWRVCGLKLEPFTLGHAHVLAAATTWRPLEEIPNPDGFFAPALFVTSRPWREAAAEFEKIGDRFALILGAKMRIARANMAEKWEVFCEYLSVSTLFPDVAAAPATPGSATRAAGSPLLCRLRLFAMRDLGLGVRAMDSRFSDVAWLFASHREEEGASRLKNEDELAFDEFCRERDLRRAEKRKAAQCGG